MKKILKYAGIGTAVILGIWIAIETVVIIFTGEEPQKEPTPIAIEEIKADPQEKEPEQQEEQPEEPTEEAIAEQPQEQLKEEPKPEKQEVSTAVEQPQEENEKEYDFVLNTNTQKYHSVHCSDGKNIKEKNKQEFHGTVSEVERMGYTACRKCGGK